MSKVYRLHVEFDYPRAVIDPGSSEVVTWLERGGAMDKGHAAEIAAWHAAVKSGGPSPIPLDELLEVSRWAIRAAEQARSNGSS